LESFSLTTGDSSLAQPASLVSDPNLDIAARLPQIITNFSNKSTGALAFFTCLLNFLGATARLGTVMVESDDFMFRLPYLIGFTLNAVIIIQFFIYWNAPTKSADKKVQQSKKSKNE
jgi:mannose-P-dolichol utilization defect protein 1